MPSIYSRIRNKISRTLNPPIIKTNEYIQWLNWVNPGMLDPGNAYCFEYALQNLPSSAPLLEVGAFCGLSTNVISYFKNHFKLDNRFFSCDKWDYDIYNTGNNIGDSKLKYSDFNEIIKGNYFRNVSICNPEDLPYPIELLSNEFFPRWERKETINDIFNRTVLLGGPLSFIYIDGDHSYEGASYDFIKSDQHLEVGGFILFDDSSELSEFGVRKVITDVKKTRRYEVVKKNPNYLFRKLKNL